MKLKATIVFALAAAASLGCNAYDPDLGDRPFRCGTETPRCPSGYTCMEYSPTDQLCEQTSGGAAADGGNAAGDARPFSCANDSELEPNNALNMATITPIPTQAEEYRLVGLAICPDTDVDVFRFNIDISGKNARADLTYQSSVGELLLDILNSTGTSIRQGTPSGGNTELLRAEVPNMPQGTYYVQVRAPAGIQNNYSIEIVTTSN
jgi:hypothetical protein